MQDTTQHAFDEGTISQVALKERLRVFNERCTFGAVSAFAGVALIAWIIWSSTGMAAALTWVLLITLVEIAILITGLRCRRALGGDIKPEIWFKVHAALAGLGGVIWGSAVWFVWKEDATLAYLATLTTLVGVAGVSMVTMSSYAKAALLFFGGLYLMPFLHVMLHTSPVASYLQVALIVGLLVQLGYTRELGFFVLRDADQYARNQALVDQLNQIVIYDQLTGAYSRRHTFEQMEQLVSTRQRHGTSASMIMFDLDHFKVINDTYGHPTGDRALHAVASAVGAQLRDGDLLGRIGGEEFLVLLPQTSMEAAMNLATRLQETLARTSITEGTNTLLLPASFGIAELRSAESSAEWFSRVDGAIYIAKEQGRNRCVAAV